MTNNEKRRAIVAIKIAVEITENMGVPPLTEKEYKLINELLEELEE